MTPVTHMPIHDLSRLPVALFGGPDDPTGGQAGGGKRPAQNAKKTAKKPSSRKASKKSGSKRR
jgi:hypothetical protein